MFDTHKKYVKYLEGGQWKTAKAFYEADGNQNWQLRWYFPFIYVTGDGVNQVLDYDGAEVIKITQDPGDWIVPNQLGQFVTCDDSLTYFNRQGQQQWTLSDFNTRRRGAFNRDLIVASDEGTIKTVSTGGWIFDETTTPADNTIVSVTSESYTTYYLCGYPAGTSWKYNIFSGVIWEYYYEDIAATFAGDIRAALTGEVYVQVGNSLCRIDPSDGSVIWEHTAGGGSMQNDTDNEGNVYRTEMGETYPEQVIKIDPSGSELWREHLPDGNEIFGISVDWEEYFVIRHRQDQTRDTTVARYDRDLNQLWEWYNPEGDDYFYAEVRERTLI